MSDFSDFSNQSFRLLREKWSDPNALAQELYAMMADTVGFNGRQGQPQQPLSAKSSEVQQRAVIARTQDQPTLPGMPTINKTVAEQRVHTPWITSPAFEPPSFTTPTREESSTHAQAAPVLPRTGPWSQEATARSDEFRPLEKASTQPGQAALPPWQSPQASGSQPEERVVRKLKTQESSAQEPSRPIEPASTRPSPAPLPVIPPIGSPEAQQGQPVTPKFSSHRAASQEPSRPYEPSSASRQVTTPPWSAPPPPPDQPQASSQPVSGTTASGVKSQSQSPGRARTPFSGAKAPSSLRRTSGGGVGFYAGSIPPPSSMYGDQVVTAYPETPNTVQVDPDLSQSAITVPEDPLIQKSYALNIPLTDFNSPMMLPTSGGTSNYQGTVISCSGTMPCQTASTGTAVTCVVQLYSNGPNQPADTTGPNNEANGQITVGMLGLASNEVIPVGTWIMGIVEVSYGSGPTIEYWAQVPVWMA